MRFSQAALSRERGRFKLFEAKLKADKKLVGTPEYQGIAYFWNYEYRHYLRDATDSQRRRVHNRFLKLGLEIAGESDEHQKIVSEITGKN